MKKIFIFIFFFIMNTIIFSQINLTEEQQMEYNRYKITIDIQSGMTGAFLGTSNLFLASNYKRWQAFIGFDRINEYTFFDVTGYEFEAKQAQKFNHTNKKLIISGLVISIIGFGMMGFSAIPITKDVDYDDPDYSSKSNMYNTQALILLVGGFGLAIGGSIPIGIGIGRSFYNWAPAQKAMEISNEFNKRLLSYIINNTDNSKY